MDVAGGEEDPVVDMQDLDCEPFQADDGPSDNDTAMGQREKEDRPATVGKKKQINKQNNQAHIRKSTRISRTPTRY